jgi:hypothetical protein
VDYPKLKRLFVAACAILLVASCAGQRPPPDKLVYKLDASSNMGGVMFGWRIANPDPRAIFYNVVWTCYDAATKVVCPERDPNSEKNMFGVPQRLNLWGAVRRPDFAAPETLSTMTYQVFMMRPGTYILSRLGEGLPQTYAFGVSLDNDTSYRFAPAGGVANQSVPRFKVEPGKMIYVGDLTFDMKTIRQGPPTVDKNEAEARAALAEYPNITVPMQPATVPE